MDAMLEELSRRPVSWLADGGLENDIVISTRIRLARNLAAMPFPVSHRKEGLEKVRDLVKRAIPATGGMLRVREYDLPSLSPLSRELLLERRLISGEMLACISEAYLVAEEDESLAVMINEEDHLRIQAVSPGLQLENVWTRISAFDDALSEKLPFAFDPMLGFLTSCPSNLGTGMRASVMLHLPGLAISGQLEPVKLALGKLDMAVRGFFGEGSENLGNLYQISNQSTLGESEMEIIGRLAAVLSRVVFHEKKAREYLLAEKRVRLQDHIGRAYGILRYGYSIQASEALSSLSALRLGVDTGMFSSLDVRTVNELLLNVQNAHLRFHAGTELSEAEADAARATLIRETLKSKRTKS